MLHLKKLTQKNMNSIVAALVFVCCIFTVIPLHAEDSSPQVVVARVNGKPILEKQITATVASRMAQYRQMGSRLPEDQLKRQIQLKELEGAIFQELLNQAADGIDSNEVEVRLQKQASATKESQEDPEKMRREIRQQILLERNGINDPIVEEREIRSFYEKNPKSFKVARSMKVQHILIRVPGNPTDAQMAEARAKAEKVLSELKKGAAFSDLARNFSDCSSKENGGDLGEVKEGYMPPEFDAAAFGLKPGEVGGPVKTRYGFHIIRVSEHFPTRLLAFEEVKEHIANYLKLELKRKKKDELVQELKKTAKIEILI